MCYIYHHPHLPLMYKAGNHISCSLSEYSFKGHAEILDPQKYPRLKKYIDADLARDLLSRRLVSSHVQKFNDTSIGWEVHRQPVPVNCTNIAETSAIFKGLKITLELRRSLESMGEGSNKPTPVIKSNQAIIT